mgnify:CR=1 FL=1
MAWEAVSLFQLSIGRLDAAADLVPGLYVRLTLLVLPDFGGEGGGTLSAPTRLGLPGCRASGAVGGYFLWAWALGSSAGVASAWHFLHMETPGRMRPAFTAAARSFMTERDL